MNLKQNINKGTDSGSSSTSTSNVGQTPCTLSQLSFISFCPASCTLPHSTHTHTHLPSCLTFQSTRAIRGKNAVSFRLKGRLTCFWRANIGEGLLVSQCVLVCGVVVGVETVDYSFILYDASSLEIWRVSDWNRMLWRDLQTTGTWFNSLTKSRRLFQIILASNYLFLHGTCGVYNNSGRLAP